MHVFADPHLLFTHFLAHYSGPSSLLATDSTPYQSTAGGGANIESYHHSSASRSFTNFNGNQRLGTVGGGAEFSFNNNNAATTGDDDIARQFASLSGG